MHYYIQNIRNFRKIYFEFFLYYIFKNKNFDILKKLQIKKIKKRIEISSYTFQHEFFSKMLTFQLTPNSVFTRSFLNCLKRKYFLFFSLFIPFSTI